MSDAAPEMTGDEQVALRERVERLEQQIAALQARAESAAGGDIEDRVCIVIFSGEWDKVFAALTLANSALALGKEVHVFCTFWGACVLRKPDAPCLPRKGTWGQRLMAWMLPRRLEDLPLSRFNFLGLGRLFLRPVMRRHNIPDIRQLFDDARELGARFHVCDTSACLFGWADEELEAGECCDRCGATSFLELALRSRTVFFI